MCILKSEAKHLLVKWGAWLNSEEIDVTTTNLGYSSDGKMSVERLSVPSAKYCGTSGNYNRVMPNDVERVSLALSKLDKVYRDYADIFFRLRQPNGKSYRETVKFFMKVQNIDSRKYQKITSEFYLKITSLLG